MSARPSAWAVGWTSFAGITMTMMGIWWAFAGLVAIFNDEFYVVTQEWIFKFDVTTWGWVHLIFGVIVMFAGINLFRGEVWARTVGVIIAVLSSLIAFAWLPYYPLWGILLIVVSISIIWSLTSHGRDITVA